MPISCPAGFVGAPAWSNGCVFGAKPEVLQGVAPFPKKVAAPVAAAVAKPAAKVPGASKDDMEWFVFYLFYSFQSRKSKHQNITQGILRKPRYSGT